MSGVKASDWSDSANAEHRTDVIDCHRCRDAGNTDLDFFDALGIAVFLYFGELGFQFGF